jgi:ribosomal protein S18 acetylase RimI-like enzyme
MVAAERLICRAARPSDVEAIAALHADSWRRHYRGAYSDAFLDGDITADRLLVWTHRLNEPQQGEVTIVAERANGLIGFAHTIFDDDPIWGALLENLHVTYGLKRNGVGSRLMAATANVVVARKPSTGVHLWVLEQNAAAQAFYEARRGVCVDRGFAVAPGGDASRLNGKPAKLRYAWSDPSVLI